LIEDFKIYEKWIPLDNKEGFFERIINKRFGIETYVTDEDMDDLEKYWEQKEKDKESNRKKAKKLGIKIWTWNEMVQEYHRTGQDCNYMPLELVGKPSYFISPTYDGTFTGEYINVSDLKTRKVDSE